MLSVTKTILQNAVLLSSSLLLNTSLITAAINKGKVITPVRKTGAGLLFYHTPTFKTLDSYLAYKKSKTVYGEDSAKAYIRQLAMTDYLPLTGGTLTGDLYGTNAYFSGNVGIGNTTARTALDVIGQGWFSSGTSGSSLIIDGTSVDNTNTSSGVRIIASSAGGSGYLKMKLDNWGGIYSWAKNSSGGEVELMRIDANTGNVGVGTLTPRGVLDVGKEINSGALGTVLARQGEVDNVGDGTYLGVKAWDTQPVNCKSFSLEHTFGGYANSAINFYRGGSYSGGYMAFATNNGTEQMVITANGNVGIGTAAPVARLQILSTAGTTTVNEGLRIVNNYNPSGNNNPTIVFSTDATSADPFTTAGQAWGLSACVSGCESFSIYHKGGSASLITPFFIDGGSGNVGIGTTAPGPYQLAVEGTLGARKIKVTLASPWADYVFDSSYQLKPLAQLEQYIKDKKHLPEVPTAEEVKKDGIDVGDNQALLLKKIEELTLYMIEMQKENQQLKKRVEQLEKKN